MSFSLVLYTASRFLVPLMLLFSIFLLLQGHSAPGGGFSGGLVASGAFVLYGMASGIREAIGALRIQPRDAAAAGLGLALASGVPGWLSGGAFLEGLWLEIPLSASTSLEIGTPLLFDAGVYVLVVGSVLDVVASLEGAFGGVFSRPRSQEGEARGEEDLDRDDPGARCAPGGAG